MTILTFDRYLQPAGARALREDGEHTRLASDAVRQT